MCNGSLETPLNECHAHKCGCEPSLNHCRSDAENWGKACGGMIILFEISAVPNSLSHSFCSGVSLFYITETNTKNTYPVDVRHGVHGTPSTSQCWHTSYAATRLASLTRRTHALDKPTWLLGNWLLRTWLLLLYHGRRWYYRIVVARDICVSRI
jgi:hypothetical protein